jgi:hypothetical protein
MRRIKNDYTVWSLVWRMGVGGGLTYGLCYYFPIVKTEAVPLWAVCAYLITSVVIALTTRE